MPEADTQDTGNSADAPMHGHRRWVRVCHWTVAVGFLTLVLSGVFILAVHPRLYWGEVGNDLTPALLEIPISNNHRPEGWQRTVTYVDVPGAPFTAERGYFIFNQNGWARSLHFLAAWVLVMAGMVYVLTGLSSGHIWRNLLPRFRELTPAALWRDALAHLRPRSDIVGGGPPYGLVQRLTYSLVLFIVLPAMLLTGLTMAPAVTTAYPALLDLFGGYQSARTLHFFGFATLLLFLTVHVAMVFVTGFRRQLRAMIWGN
jgi:thiosulfate reductase cytochrome b subunit